MPRFPTSLRRAPLWLALFAVSACDDGALPDYRWQPALSELPGAMYSIWGTSPTDVYAVGGDALDGNGPLAVHFDGTRWTRFDTGTTTGTLWWVYGPTPGSVFMVGSGGTVVRYDTATHHGASMMTPSHAPTLFGVWGVSDRDLWAVGGDTDTNAGVIWHYNGTAWANIDIPSGLAQNAVLYKVWGTAANDVWVCGENGLTLHYNGTAWSQATVPMSARGDLFTVHGRGAERYAVGGGVSGIILEADGTGWRQAALDSPPRFNGVFVPPSGSPLAVGNTGELYQRRNGAWREVARPPRTMLDFHAVWVDPAGAVWAVGGDLNNSPARRGLIYHFGDPIPTNPMVTAPELTTCTSAPGVVCTLAGNGEEGYNGDGRALRDTMFYWTMDMEFAPDGTPYMLDWNNHRVRRFEADHMVHTVIGTDEPGDGPPDQSDLMPTGAPGTTVALNHPTDMLFDPQGRMILVSWHNHKIRMFDPATGRVTVLLGRGPGGADGNLTDARLKQPSKAAFAPGNTVLYILDQGNGQIRRLDLTAGMLTTIAGTRGMRGYMGDGGPAMTAMFNWQSGENPEPEGGLAVGPDGAIYVSDTGNQRIRRIDPMTNVITTVAGNGMYGYSGDGGPATMAQLNGPQDIEFGPDGKLYIADTNNHRIRVLDLTTGVIDTYAGNGQRGNGGDRGMARDAQFYRPYGITFDSHGTLYVSDTRNNRIRTIAR